MARLRICVLVALLLVCVVLTECMKRGKDSGGKKGSKKAAAAAAKQSAVAPPPKPRHSIVDWLTRFFCCSRAEPGAACSCEAPTGTQKKTLKQLNAHPPVAFVGGETTRRRRALAFTGQYAAMDGFCKASFFGGKSPTGFAPALSGGAEEMCPEFNHAYSLLYDRDDRVPIWVAYGYRSPATDFYDKKNDRRPDNWHGSEGLLDFDDKRMNHFFGALLFDRGHMAPAGAFSADVGQFNDTYFLGNMAPQFKDLNRWNWAQMEIAIRKYFSRKFGKGADNFIYVVVGSFNDKSRSARYINGDEPGVVQWRVPDYFFSAVFDEANSLAVGWVASNLDEDRDKYHDTSDHVGAYLTPHSVEAVERFIKLKSGKTVNIFPSRPHRSNVDDAAEGELFRAGSYLPKSKDYYVDFVKA